MTKFLKILLKGLSTLILILILNYSSVSYLDQKIAESDKHIYKNGIRPIDSLLLPSQFIESERFYLKIETTLGDSILAYCDTGGGLSMLMPKMNRIKEIDKKIRFGIFKGIIPMKYILFNDLVKDDKIPEPYILKKRILRNPFKIISNPYLIIPSMDKELVKGIEIHPELDVFLGQDFFMNHSWTFDYINKMVWLNTPIQSDEIGSLDVQKIGFKKNEKGLNLFGHPRMSIVVDGEKIDVLFDTGATSILTEEGKKQFKTNKKSLGSSFIAASIFERWMRKHPEWKYYPKSDLLGDMIEVPKIRIGTMEVGPVLFANRPDKNWSEGMISTMDKVVQGAIGGSALKFFKVTIDYNSELIKFKI